MRMYGRENIEVVQPTNAVNATRNTLNGSTKNCSRPASSGPSFITRSVSAAPAISVAKLMPTLASAAQARAPKMPRNTQPSSGMARTTNTSISLFPELFEVLQVEAVELLADLEEEHAQNHHADQDVERDAELDDHRHAVGRAGSGEEQAVFHRQETDDLRDRLAPRD